MYGECPIRLSWSFGGQRYQTTLGFSVAEADWDETRRLMKPGTHNKNGQSADDVNFYIKRIRLVVAGLERQYNGNEKALSKARMKQAVGEALSTDIARPEDIVERCMEGMTSLNKPETKYYEDRHGQYYQYLCDAKIKYVLGNSYYILQQLFGKRERIAVPKHEFEPTKEKGRRNIRPNYEIVNYEKVFGC